MRRRTAPYSIVATLSTLLFLTALVLSGEGCDWGSLAYMGVGLAMLIALLTVPYVSRRSFHRASRLPMALLFGLAGLMVWLLGWFVFFVRGNC